MTKRARKCNKKDILAKLDELCRLVEIMDGDVNFVIGWQYNIISDGGEI